MPTIPPEHLSTPPHPPDSLPSLADILSSATVLSLTSSVQSPIRSTNRAMPLAVCLPPELLLDIFNLISGLGPQKRNQYEDYLRYLERNRNLKSVALVHSTWRKPARQALQEEVFLNPCDGPLASSDAFQRGEITEERMRQIQNLVDFGLQGSRYLSVYGRLDAVIAVSGMAMWANLRDLVLIGTSRSDGTTSLADFAGFPLLEKLSIIHLPGQPLSSDYLPSDRHLLLPNLRELSLDGDINIDDIDELSQWSGTASQRLYQDFQALSRKLFLPANMPNLAKLEIHVSLTSPYGAPVHKTLAFWTEFSATADGGHEQLLLSTILSGNEDEVSIIHSDSVLLPPLDGKHKALLKCKSLYLCSWMLEREPKLVSRLVRWAKGEDQIKRGRLGKVVVCGTTPLERLKWTGEERALFEWRDDERRPRFDDFDGR